MTNLPSIMIVDDCVTLCKKLESSLASTQSFKSIEIVTNSTTAIERILSAKPELLLLDIVMPTIDGEEILEQLKDQCSFPMGIIVISALDSQRVIQRCMSLGVHYYLIKPISPAILCKKISHVHHEVFSEQDYSIARSPEACLATASSSAERSSDPISAWITKQLLKIGVSPKLKGFSYLKDSINYIYNSYNDLSALTKVVYPHIAKIYDTQPEKVERSIRTAIDRAFSTANSDYYFSTFASPIDELRPHKHPSNREFMFAVVNYIRDNLHEANINTK